MSEMEVGDACGAEGRGRAWLMVGDEDVVVGDGGVKSCDGDGDGVDDRSWRWR